MIFMIILEKKSLSAFNSLIALSAGIFGIRFLVLCLHFTKYQVQLSESKEYEFWSFRQPAFKQLKALKDLPLPHCYNPAANPFMDSRNN